MPVITVRFPPGGNESIRRCLEKYVTPNTARQDEILALGTYRFETDFASKAMDFGKCIEAHGGTIVELPATPERSALADIEAQLGAASAQLTRSALGEISALEGAPTEPDPRKLAYARALQLTTRWTEIYKDLALLSSRTALFGERGYAVLDGVVNMAMGAGAIAAVVAAWQPGGEARPALQIGVALVALKTFVLDGWKALVKKVPEASVVARKVSENVVYGRVVRSASSAAAAAYEAITVPGTDGRVPRPGLADATIADAELLEAGTKVIAELQSLGERLRDARSEFEHARTLFAKADLLPTAEADAAMMAKDVEALLSPDPKNPGIVWVLKRYHEDFRQGAGA